MENFYQVVGQNNRNLLVQCNKVVPYHEDFTRIQPFEPSAVSPGETTRIRIDCKHSLDREIVLNDIRLRFRVDFGARTGGSVGRVFAVRGTDLIREFIVRINEDIVFKVDKRFDLSMLYEMNNHKTTGDPKGIKDAHLLNNGNIPAGNVPAFIYDDRAYSSGGKRWYFSSNGVDTISTASMTIPGEERHDGRPRLIYDDSVSPVYQFQFDISLNQLVGPIFQKLHLRRVEYVQLEIRFEPWVSREDTQNLLLFGSHPTLTGSGAGTAVAHPYSVARFTNLEIRQYRTTLLSGIHGFTMSDNRMLSWLMHRFSRREYTFNFDTSTQLDIQLHDWEIRTNIVRIWWMWAPRAIVGSDSNFFVPFGEPCEPFDYLSGVEIIWKNDRVLDLDTTHMVQRHYILSDNKRYGFEDPFIRFARLTPNLRRFNQTIDGHQECYNWQYSIPASGDKSVAPTANTTLLAEVPIGDRVYEFPIYHVDLNMNVHQGVPGAEIIGGIINDTSDYVIRLKRLSDMPNPVDSDNTRRFIHTGTRTLWVFLEYQTLVNLSANSNQFNRSSQVITKQLNSQ